jgi:subfamily B ATP-binding cassette protein MsbA
MGIVTQDSILFNDTIANNISLGIENPTREKIIEAAKIANAHEFIMEFPNQYDSPVGDGGGMLSGGQKQRIAIARAVMKNPPIMILDEATSALDTESEKLVQDAIENMMKNRTSLVIAHRLSTIQNAATILVYKVFSDGFVGQDLGSSAAQSVILLVVVGALTIFQFKFVERRVHY